MRIDVGIGEYAVSSNREDLLKTYGLGSCVAVMVYDKKNQVAGLIHLALPDSTINAEKARTKPGYFVDTGLKVFLEELNRYGVTRGSGTIKIAGGASIMDDNKTFDIGRRNVIAIKRELWKKGFGVIKEDIGGTISRTVSISVETGEIVISNGRNLWTL